MQLTVGRLSLASPARTRQAAEWVAWPALGLLVVGFSALACTTVRTYDGAELPPEKIGIVTVYSKGTDLEVAEVDGKAVNLKVNGWVDQRDCKIQLLPGNHTMKVKVREQPGVSGLSVVVLALDVEAGHACSLRSDAGGAGAERTDEFGRKSVELTYYPYVLDTTTGRRASTPVTPASS